MADSYLRLAQLVNNPKTGARGLLGVSRSFFFNAVKQGLFPKPIKLSPRVCVWRQSDIEAFIAKK